MPSTVNGIGTRYCGERNRESRLAECRSCGSYTQLASYDTRLWFVVFFIPIIPLGRKRITDQCSACGRHYVADADQWETARQLNVSGAQAKYDEEPTPENAMALHQMMVNFNQSSAAEKFRGTMVERFPYDAIVHAYLGDSLSDIGIHKEAEKFYNRAYELRSDLPAARMGIAQIRIMAGKLDEARQLLDFLEKPGAGQIYSLGLLEHLADVYQRAGRHEPALELYGRLLAEYPNIAQYVPFRKKVETSEKALKRRGKSILPKRQRSWKDLFKPKTSRPADPSGRITWRGLAKLGVTVALIAGALAIGNEYVRRHRTLHFVSGFREPAKVAIDGVGTVTVDSKAPQSLKLKEGHYHARISGPVNEEFDFDIAASYMNRWSDDPAWVINVGGSAVLLQQRVTYAKSNPPPPTINLHYGRSFQRFAGIDHPFSTMPTSVQVKGSQSKSLTGLELAKGKEPLAYAQYFLMSNRENEAMDFLEWHLARNHGDEEAVEAYMGAAYVTKKLQRGAKFLEAGLETQPINIQWHRTYSTLAREPESQKRLVALYDRMLQGKPNDSALLYLRGRVDPIGSGKEWFEKAVAADGRNAFAHFALGSFWMSQADWKHAKAELSRAVELNPKNVQFDEALFVTRMALKEWKDLEKELRAKSNPRDGSAATANHLIDVLVAQGRPDDAKRVVDDFSKAIIQYSGEFRSLIDGVKQHWLYALGNFEELARFSAGERKSLSRLTRAIAQIELGKPADAAATLVKAEAAAVNASLELALALGFHLAGNPAEAKSSEERALAQWDAGDGEDRDAAALLRSATPPPESAVAANPLHPSEKALLCCLLATKHPSNRAVYLDWAKRLNVDRDFPYHLVNRATGAKK